MHLVNIYQHRTLAEVKDAIEKAWLDPETVLRFSQWMHLEEPANEAQYEGDKDIVALAWRRRCDDGSHEGICRLPRCLTAAAQRDGPNALERSETFRDGCRWRESYDNDVQFMFSRVQEHVHMKTKKGMIPLRACLSKRCKTKCKHGFPKRLLEKCTAVCNGNYRRLGVRVSGRRNALGSILGRRTTEYQSGTLRGFAATAGSNTHTAPNFRLPPCEATHDPSCKNERCLAALRSRIGINGTSQLELLRMCKVLHRASKEAG